VKGTDEVLKRQVTGDGFELDLDDRNAEAVVVPGVLPVCALMESQPSHANSVYDVAPAHSVHFASTADAFQCHNSKTPRTHLNHIRTRCLQVLVP